ncbi:MAG: PPC domain-containing protein [Geitlerinemataceae cyanobacterium]
MRNFARFGLASIATLAAVLMQSTAPAAAQYAEEELAGELTASDTVLEFDGSFYDTYDIQGRAGETVEIYMNSAEFDTYLLLADPTGEAIAQNDDADDGSGTTNSALVFTFPTDGTYQILFNSFGAGATGAYEAFIYFYN